MSLNNMGFGFLFTAKDAASPTFRKVGRNFTTLDHKVGASSASMEGNLSRTKVAFAAFAVSLGVLFAAFAGASPAGRFEQQIQKVGAIARSSVEDLNALRNAALDAGLATQFSPEEAAIGLGNLASQGYSAKESMQALLPSLNLAAGGQISVGDATVATSSALKVFSLDVSHATAVADKLLRVTNITALKASDLSLALGTVGRGASAAKQSIDEMLPVMGLIKNTGVDASVAASATSSALLAMAKNAGKFKAIGVSISDAQGRFRPFMDVVLDVQDAMSSLTDTERVKKATELFGRFGLTAFSAISGQLGKGIKDASGEILKGAAAVAFLRDTMKNSGGAADEFKNKILGTFAGQKTLLKGSMETLAITIGQPLAAVLKPIVESIITGMNALIKAIRAMPGPLKRFIAGFTVAAASGVALLSGILLLKAALGPLKFAIRSVTMAMRGLVMSAWPLLLVVGLVVGAIAGLKYAIDNNIGGIGESFHRMWKRASLAWKGIVQLVSTGEFSGAVLDELNKVENKGIKRFAKNIFGIVFRIKKFFKGLADTFQKTVSPGVEFLSISFKYLMEQMKGLLEVFGVSSDVIDAFSTSSSSNFESVGSVFGFVFGLVADTILATIGLFVQLVGVVVWVVKKVASLGKWFGGILYSMGETVVDWAKSAVSGVKRIFSGLASVVKAIIRPIGDFFSAMADRIRDSLAALRDSMINMARKVPSWMQTSGVRKFAALQTSGEEKSAKSAAESAAFVESLPAAASARVTKAQTQLSQSSLSEFANNVAKLTAAINDAQNQQVVVTIDGEAIASASSKAHSSVAARSFSSSPNY